MSHFPVTVALSPGKLIRAVQHVPNAFEDRNRSIRVDALVQQLDKEAVTEGVNNLDPSIAAGLVAQLEKAPSEFWRDLAARAGITPPSQFTRAAVVQRYRWRAT